MSVERIKSQTGGILVVDKPRGLTSRAVVDRVVRLAGRVKVGHAGTLDPLASGVLVVCVGPATRLVEEIRSGAAQFDESQAVHWRAVLAGLIGA